jgi:hypothetical protein
VRVPSAWASQSVLLAALGDVAPPDAVLRDETLARDLALLGASPRGLPEDDPASLAGICDPEIEQAARAAYPRDYVTFGYGAWR